jgi:hypothetical protein
VTGDEQRLRRGGIDGLMVAAGVGIGFVATLACLIVGLVVVNLEQQWLSWAPVGTLLVVGLGLAALGSRDGRSLGLGLVVGWLLTFLALYGLWSAQLMPRNG